MWVNDRKLRYLSTEISCCKFPECSRILFECLLGLSPVVEVVVVGSELLLGMLYREGELL